jgi:hypothetical protein
VLVLCDDKTSEEEREDSVDMPPELDRKTKEELLLPSQDIVEELMLVINELVVLDVKFANEVVFTNPGGGGFTAGLVAVLVVVDTELKGTVEVLVKVTVVDVELGSATELGDVVAENEIPLEVVRVIVEPDWLRVLCKTVEGVKEVPGGVGAGLPLNVREVAVDAIWEEVTMEGTTGPLGAKLELDAGKVVAKNDDGGELGTSELPEGTSTPEVVDGSGKDTVNCVVSMEEPAGAEVGTPDGLYIIEDEPKGLPEDTGVLPVDAADGRFGGPIEENPGRKFDVLPNDTVGEFDAVAEAVIGTLGCAFDGTDEDTLRVGADEVTTGLPGEPELSRVFVVALEAEMPDDGLGICVSAGAPLEVDGLPHM